MLARANRQTRAQFKTCAWNINMLHYSTILKVGCYPELYRYFYNFQISLECQRYRPTRYNIFMDYDNKINNNLCQLSFCITNLFLISSPINLHETLHECFVCLLCHKEHVYQNSKMNSSIMWELWGVSIAMTITHNIWSDAEKLLTSK